MNNNNFYKAWAAFVFLKTKVVFKNANFTNNILTSAYLIKSDNSYPTF